MALDDTALADENELRRLCELLGLDQLRSTASPAHERTIAAVERELARIPGLAVRTEEFQILRWLVDDLESAGHLAHEGTDIPVAGAVPYCKPAQQAGELVHVPAGQPITDAVRGKVVLRDFPEFPVPYDLVLPDLLHGTDDLEQLRGQVYDRPGFADEVLHQDLLAAGAAGAAGLIVAFDLPHEQLTGYWEPHKGTHYAIPAVFVGVDERDHLMTLLGQEISVSVQADIATATTRNVFATLPGRSPERLVLLTHTDGNTWVQENGPAGLLALGAALAHLPLTQRERTIELAFTSGHLHISREGSQRYAQQIDDAYDDESNDVGAVIALEHLGTRELLPVPRVDGPGRELVATGEAEVLIWSVGPSEAMRAAVGAAVAHRRPARTAVLPGLFASSTGQVPTYGSMGGIGTYFHWHLIPTMALISGPWSLWAPSFGAAALDFSLLRAQLLAVGDVVRALDRVPREHLAGDYPTLRRARAQGAPTWPGDHPPEVAVALAEAR